jgi:hypothetical protein
MHNAAFSLVDADARLQEALRKACSVTRAAASQQMSVED